MKNLSEHNKYLKKLKHENIFIHSVRIGLLVFLVVLWEILSDFEIIDPFIMSSPSRIAKTISELFNGGTLFFHIGVTLLETLVGFVIATVFGTFFASLNWWSKKVNAVAEPYLVVLNSLPKIALGPIIIIWFGAGMNAIIAMTVLICIIITIITVQNAFYSTPEEMIKLLRGMGANKINIFRKLVFPYSLPTIISMLKINVGLSFVGSIMGEYLVSRAGLGYLIVYGGQIFDLDLVLACTVILMLLAGLIYYAVSLLEKCVITRKAE